MNFYQLLRERALLYRDKCFLRIDDHCHSYASFLADVDGLANDLADLHIVGDVVIYSEDFLETAWMFFAVQKIGARPIAAHRGVMNNILQAGKLEDVAGVLTMERDVLSWHAFAKAMSPLAGCMGVCTSGSTGRAKILYRTYESWTDFFPVQNEAFGVREDSRLYLHGSLGFTGNLNTFLAVLHCGATIITTKGFYPRELYRVFADYDVDTIYLVPHKLRLLTQGQGHAIHAVRSIFTGSQLVSAKLLKAIRRRFPKTCIHLYYGASELNYITYRTLEDDGFDERDLGVPFAGVQLEIRDGVIFVTTPYHVSNVSCPFALGDLGEMDAAGRLRFLGRRTDVVNRGGYKIHLADLKSTLEQIAGVAAAEVLGYKDARRYEEVAAFLVLERDVQKGQVETEMRKLLPPVERPKSICYLDAIPLNDRGKADKEALYGCLARSRDWRSGDRM